ncbi:hypothetical protein MC885_006421, partial [Smutsia gigantea]
MTSLSAKVIKFMLSIVNLANATAIPEAATTISLWTHFHLSTTEGVEEFVTTVTITLQEETVSCVRITFSDKLVQILQPKMFANPVIVIKLALGTMAFSVIRQCNQCQNGFYNLQELDPDGCSPCNCNTSGTVNGDITCHPNSGQCKCKANVIGLRCNHCSFGFKFLRSFNVDGCEPCLCNLHGSVNKLCNPLSGQCECKKEAKGLQCDTCREHFYGLDITGCKACNCNTAGSLSGTACDARTG